jgi:hypothetical protein
MDTNQVMPENGSQDAADREYSEICGYANKIPVPVGSIVTLLPGRFGQRGYDFYNWRKGIVTRREKDPDGYGDDYLIFVRKLDNLSDWEPWTNTMRWAERHVRVDTVGNGEPPVAGKDYPLCRKEILDARYKAMDHTYQEWRNPATFLAFIQLRTTQEHYRAVMGMVRQNGSINPERLKNYWYRHCETTLPDWGKYPDGFPSSLEYLYRVDWVEIAKDFSEHARELRDFDERRIDAALSR